MKNPNSPLKRLIRALMVRWSIEDYPGADLRFHLPYFGRDLGIFIGVPLLSTVALIQLQRSGQKPHHANQNTQKYSDSFRMDSSKSQIISFQGSAGVRSPYSGVAKRAPGTLVRLRLLNLVETFSTAPVHAQITDTGLGKTFLGGILIGDANPDPNFERINMTFRFAREPGRDDLATPIAARALSLDGTLGVEAEKKEGFFTRSVFGSAGAASQGLNTNSGSVDLKDILFRALSSGFLQEFGAGVQVEKNRAQVLSMQPDTEFFAELTDYFPAGGGK